MWTKLIEAKNVYVADMWRELFSAEALSVRMMPASSWADAADMEPYTIYVPWGKTHVAQEVLRKI